MTVSTDKPSENTSTEVPRKRNHTLLKLTVLFLLFGLAWFLYWFMILRFEVSTDDAYVGGNIVNVTPVVPGSVVAYYTDDTQLVKQGQKLIQLDPTAYRITCQKELAALGSTVLQVKQLYDNVKVAKTNLKTKRILAEKAKYDWENRGKLVGNLAVSNEEFIHSRDSYNIAEQDYNQAVHQLQVALDAAGNTPIEKHPLIETQKNKIREAYFNLQHTAIYAATTGYVAKRNVEVGQYVTQGNNLLAIIPVDHMWVNANFKETQLTYVRIGQPVYLTLDLYGRGVMFNGKVEGISPGTGSAFSIIPPQNATGNWIKIVQRLPVRVVLDPEMIKKYPLRIGLSAEVTIDITNTNLPMLAEVPSTEVVAKTDVFKIDLKELETLMDKIVKFNLEAKES